MSENISFVPSGRDSIDMVSERRLTFFSCHTEQINLLYRIVSEDPLEPRQYYLGLEVSMEDGIQDVKPKFGIDQTWNKSL